jgi:hypothetical protein
VVKSILGVGSNANTEKVLNMSRTLTADQFVDVNYIGVLHRMVNIFQGKLVNLEGKETME